MRGGVLAEVSQLLGEGRAGAGQRQQVQHHGGGARDRAVQVHVSRLEIQSHCHYETTGALHQS